MSNLDNKANKSNPLNPAKEENGIVAFIRHNLKRARKQKPFTLIVLFFVTLAFAALGVGNYVRDTISTDVVATVGKQQIPLNVLEYEIDNFVNYARQENKYSEKELRSPAIIRQKLSEMVQAQLIAQFVYDHNLIPSDAKLAAFIAQLPEFQSDGKFSKELYLERVRSSRVSVDDFENNFRLTVARDEAVSSILETSFIPNSSQKNWLAIVGENREVLPHSVVGDKYADAVKYTDADIEKYFQDNKEKYIEPVQVKINFLEFSPTTLRDTIKADDKDLKEYYEEVRETLFPPGRETRNARHILISVEKDASEEIKAQELAKINEILTKAKANPENFAQLAEEYSQDPGSKNNGGLYEGILPGMMVEQFDQALFALKPGEISEVVETQFGYHIIYLEKINLPTPQNFENLKPQVLESFKDEEAQTKYQVFVEEVKLTLDEQADNANILNTIAEEYGLNIINTDWVNIHTDIFPFDNTDILNAALSAKALDKKVVTLTPRSENRLIAMVVTEVQPQRALSFEEVKAQAEKDLRQNLISKLIAEDVNQKLTTLRSGNDNLIWESPILVSRLKGQLPQALQGEIYSIPAEEIPAYVSYVENENKTVIYKINQIVKDNKLSSEEEKQAVKLYDDYWQSRIVDSLLAALMEKYPVKINEAVLARLLNKNEEIQ